jgi:hypothetical protein
MQDSLKFSLMASSLIVAAAVPALAGVTVNSPYNNETVSSSFPLSAWASSCSSQTVGAMGYSLDNSPDTTIVNGSSVNTTVSSPTGNHTLHVKAWGPHNAACVTDVAINVGANSGGSVIIAPDAISVSSIQALSNWKNANDTGTNAGVASGWMSEVSWPSRSGSARKAVMSSANYGGERFYVSFGDDESSSNFVYDTWIYLPSPSSTIANVEMDMNQTMSNGMTVIFGFQCDGWNGTWDYTKNAGSPEKPVDTWVRSHAHCNPREWSQDTWHHVQIGYSRDGSGNVNYQSVWLDGTEQAINATVPSAFKLGWGPVLLTNLQIDSATYGWSTSTVYLDSLTVYRW